MFRDVYECFFIYRLGVFEISRSCLIMFERFSLYLLGETNMVEYHGWDMPYCMSTMQGRYNEVYGGNGEEDGGSGLDDLLLF